MTFLRPSSRTLALALLLALGACSRGPRPETAATAAPVGVAEVDAILALLDTGQEDAARSRIKAALKRDPGNSSLQLLRDSIDRDPQELLGPTSYAYTVKPGDTIGGLAERLLGNRLKAYQLARYNKIANPSLLAAGTVLRIPGVPPRAEPVRRPDPRPENAAPRPRPAAPKPTPAPTPPRAQAPANPAAARQARAAGLAALNGGNVARAVTLLRRAAALDPRDPAIARDLARAERIAATVRARQ